jgi:circadian clock protein KaiC
LWEVEQMTRATVRQTTAGDRAASGLRDKAPTGIAGFDEITGGGLPRGRVTLVSGAAGSGKTVFGAEFLARGARQFGEPGVLLCFEESADELMANVSSLGFDLADLQRDGQLVIDALGASQTKFVQTGPFDLEGLFLRIGGTIEAVGAKRVVLDTLEVLFAALGDEATVRAELGRLFRWLKDSGVTVVVTAETGGPGQLSRFGFEEYLADCVVSFDNRVVDEQATRRVRIVKYRGSTHGPDEYTFLIGRGGLVVLTNPAAQHYDISGERISTGIERLDHMLSGGPYRGSTVLLTGTPGTGKTTIAAMTAQAACARGESVVFLSFEEAPTQLLRNMRSIGVNLGPWVEKGQLHLQSVRRSGSGFAEHLAMLQALLQSREPSLVVLDGVGSLQQLAPAPAVGSALARQLEMIKSRGATVLLTSLAHSTRETSELAVSSLVDTWLMLRSEEAHGERNRLLSVIKSRGMPHSHRVCELVLSRDGATVIDVYVSARGVLAGSARLAQQAQDQKDQREHAVEVARRHRLLDRRTAQVEKEIAALRADLAAESAAQHEFADAPDGAVPVEAP